jgi:formylglycine-generating enzyme required for sulfatase activity
VRPLPAILLLAALAHAPAAEPPAAPSWPLWDGSESIEQYAKRANLEPTKTLDLGNGVKLEMVLIPAGKFTMGTEKPTPVDEQGFREKIVVGRAVLAMGAGTLLVLLGTVVVRAIRRRGRPQYSLARFVAMILAAGVGVLGGTHWWKSAGDFAQAQSEYQAALARFKDSYDWEKPAHEVTLSTPYYIGKCEVTQEQYQQVMGNNPSHFKGRDLPVEQVSWDEAQEFCKKASEKTGLTIRLPTDAEWECACRAGTRTTYYTGDTEADLDRAAWYDKNSGNATHPVGQKTANAWGVHDMHGNVWEWCGDWFETYKAEAAVDPQGPPQSARRVLRGGSWGDAPRGCRSAFRMWDFPGFRNYFVGFRVAAWVPRTP